jgi:hypothetical protein
VIGIDAGLVLSRAGNGTGLSADTGTGLSADTGDNRTGTTANGEGEESLAPKRTGHLMSSGRSTR